MWEPKMPLKQRKFAARKRWLAVGVVLVLISTGWLMSSNTGQKTVTPVAAPTEVSTSSSDEVFTAPRPGRDVSWRVFAGLDMPVSATAGPHCLTETRASCFAHTADGAAMAAAQILVRTFPFAGSDTFIPTISEQVTGSGAPALARLTRQTYDQAAKAVKVQDGAPLGSADGWIAGYRLDGNTDPTGPTAKVDVLIMGGGEGLGFTSFDVALTWQNGDWRLVAPTWGDWRSNAHPVRNPYPASYRSYDNLGLGAGGAS
jgi:hypothetical protein